MNDDPDADGIPNGIEYVVDGMNPGIADAHSFPKPRMKAGDFVHSFPRRAGTEDVEAGFHAYDEGMAGVPTSFP